MNELLILIKYSIYHYFNTVWYKYMGTFFNAQYEWTSGWFDQKSDEEFDRTIFLWSPMLKTWLNHWVTSCPWKQMQNYMELPQMDSKVSFPFEIDYLGSNL